MKQEVKQEADNIRKFATKEEIAKLDFEALWTPSLKLCIYGQMTGHCHSERAIELIEKCAVGYFHDIYSDFKIDNIGDVKQQRHFSSLEHEIHNNPKGNKKLIEYIKS